MKCQLLKYSSSIKMVISITKVTLLSTSAMSFSELHQGSNRDCNSASMCLLMYNLALILNQQENNTVLGNRAFLIFGKMNIWQAQLPGIVLAQTKVMEEGYLLQNQQAPFCDTVTVHSTSTTKGWYIKKF